MSARIPLVLLLGLLAAGCDDSAELCEAWQNASCPSDFPDLQHGVEDSTCEGHFDFSCGEDCDEEHRAVIECQTESPNCCNDVECNDGSSVCSDLYTVWADCTDRVRDACE